jgi:hypothetical protein
MAGKPLWQRIRAHSSDSLETQFRSEERQLFIPILGNGIDFVHSLSTFTIP